MTDSNQKAPSVLRRFTTNRTKPAYAALAAAGVAVAACAGDVLAVAPPAALAQAASGRAGPASGPSAQNQATYWLPPGIGKVRGMVVTGMARNPNADWQAFCTRHSFGIATDVGSLPAIAKATSHPEIEFANIVTLGNSAGALRATQTALANIDRVIAVVPVHGAMLAKGNDGFNVNRGGDTPGDIQTLDVTPLLTVPMLLMYDDGDGFVSPVNQEGFLRYGRAEGAPWAMSIDSASNHTSFDEPFRKVTFPWLDAVVELRLPPEAGSARTARLREIVLADGWLADLRTKEIAPAADFKGNQTKANWFPNEAVAKAWKDFATVPPYQLPDQPLIQPSGLIADLVVLDSAMNDTTSGIGWRINSNFKEADQLYNNIRYYVQGPLPGIVTGCDWIRPKVKGKKPGDYTVDPIAKFRVTADAIVYIAHDERVTPKPPWLADWKDTGEKVLVSGGMFNMNSSLCVYQKSFAAGATVTLGANGSSGGGTVMYITLVKPVGSPATSQP